MMFLDIVENLRLKGKTKNKESKTFSLNMSIQYFRVCDLGTYYINKCFLIPCCVTSTSCVALNMCQV